MVRMKTPLALILLATAGCASARPDPRDPDALRCTVKEAETPGTYRVTMRLEGPGGPWMAPSLVVLPGAWSHIRVLDMGARAGREFDAAGNPTVAETIESGVAISLRCTPRDDGRLDLELRSWWFRDARIVAAVDDEATVAYGEERAFAFRD
jgi:hypothetical protein